MTIAEWFDTLFHHHKQPVANTKPITVTPITVAPTPPPPVDINDVAPTLTIQGDDLGAKLAKAMIKHGYNLAIGGMVMNIIYVEGMNPDGTKNANRPNAFDAVRCLLRIYPDGRTRLMGIWEATTHAGLYWTHHRMNPKGAFQISLGQQASWTMGHYHDQEALVQTEEIVGTRDDNEDFKRDGPVYKGLFGVHHHWGYNYPKDDVGRSSAGCQVGRNKDGHREFIAKLKTDSRYKQNHNFLFPSTVLLAEWVE